MYLLTLREGSLLAKNDAITTETFEFSLRMPSYVMHELMCYLKQSDMKTS